METKLTKDKVATMCKQLSYDNGFEVPRIGLGGGLMLLCKENVMISVQSSSSNHISCFISFDNQHLSWHFSGFYGDLIVSNRHMTWELLQHLRIVAHGPWLVMGDFNEVLS